jgi:hypothetical protein
VFFVPTKSEQQQSGLMLHRSRQLLVRQRTMLSNAIRGHLAELGIISAKGRNGTAELFKIIADEKDGRIPAAARFSLDVLARQHAAIAAEIGAIEKRIHAWHRSSEESRRLEQIPGVGPIVATAGDLEARIVCFVEHYNHSRYHESLQNLTPADVYFGRGQAIILERERIKRDTIKQRRLQHRLKAA